MTKTMVKTFNGYKVVYHSDYKTNPFVITRGGKVVERYRDFHSCLYWLTQHLRNFESVEFR